MALRNGVELESTIMARLHHLVTGLTPQPGGEAVIENVIRNSVFTTLFEMWKSGMIPAACVDKDPTAWCMELASLAVVDISAGDENHVPRLNFSVKALSEKAFERLSGRRPTSQFIRSIRAETGRVIQDENLRLEVERRGLEMLLRPEPPRVNRLAEARARMAAQVQEDLRKEAEERAERAREEEKKDRDEAERAAIGYQRKVELD